jgi:hypothetical protein
MAEEGQTQSQNLLSSSTWRLERFSSVWVHTVAACDLAADEGPAGRVNGRAGGTGDMLVDDRDGTPIWSTGDNSDHVQLLTLQNNSTGESGFFWGG